MRLGPPSGTESNTDELDFAELREEAWDLTRRFEVIAKDDSEAPERRDASLEAAHGRTLLAQIDEFAREQSGPESHD